MSETVDHDVATALKGLLDTIKVDAVAGIGNAGHYLRMAQSMKSGVLIKYIIRYTQEG